METDEILQAYANRKRMRWYAVIGFLICGVLWMAVANDWSIAPGLRIGVGLLFVLILFYIMWRYWRCPACDRMLGRDTYAHCPHCGTRLEA